MRVLIYGSRPDGHAKVLVDVLQTEAEHDVVGLVDDYDQNRERRIRGLEVLGTWESLDELRASGVDGAVLGFGEADGRVDATQRVAHAGLALPAVVHRSAVVSASATIAPGCQVLAGAYVGPDASLGPGVLVNTGAIVEHDARLEEGSVVGPRAVLTGRVVLAQEVEIGAGATVLPDVRIGAHAVVGAGAVVTADIPADFVAVGVPARARPRRRELA